MKDLQNKVMAAVIFASILGGTTMAYASSGNLANISTKLGVSQTQVKEIIDKQEAGDALTGDEQKIFNTVKNQMENGGFHQRGKGDFGGGMKIHGPMMNDFTEAEKIALESMTDTQKHDFFEQKRIENEANMEQRETVIDKKLNDEALTDAEKVILKDIKTQRATMKTQRLEQKAAFDAVKPILEKKKNGETLTNDEQNQLDQFEVKNPHQGKGERRGRGDFGMMIR